MDQPKSYENEIREIEQLLDLVERVDERIRRLERSLFTQNRNLFALFSGLIVLIFASVMVFTTPNLSQRLTSNPLLIILLSISFLLLFSWIFLSIVSQYIVRIDNDKQLQVENRIMGDLVQMLSSLVERIKPHISIVTYATMEMRLRRIRFTPSRALSKSYTTKVRTAPAEGEIVVNEI